MPSIKRGLMFALSLAVALNLLLVAGFAAASSNTTGSHAYVEESGNAISICKGALPAYETLLRQRPLAMVNEGQFAAFVNCGFRAPTNSKGQDWFAATLKNYSTTSVTVRCTGVFGVEGNNARYVVKSVTLAPGQAKEVRWSKTDNNGQLIQTNTGLQCLLPPQVALTELPQAYYQRH